MGIDKVSYQILARGEEEELGSRCGPRSSSGGTGDCLIEVSWAWVRIHFVSDRTLAERQLAGTAAMGVKMASLWRLARWACLGGILRETNSEPSELDIARRNIQIPARHPRGFPDLSWRTQSIIRRRRRRACNLRHERELISGTMPTPPSGQGGSRPEANGV